MELYGTYCVVVKGIVWYGIALPCMVLQGTVWYLHSIIWYCKVSNYIALVFLKLDFMALSCIAFVIYWIMLYCMVLYGIAQY